MERSFLRLEVVLASGVIPVELLAGIPVSVNGNATKGLGIVRNDKA
jgi:hypothetical protein